MKSLLLLAVAAAGVYYYYLQHPEIAAKYRAPAATRVVRSAPPATPAPSLHYHSPLDASNGRSSAGYYSTQAPERYEVTGQRSTAPGRALQTFPPAGNPRSPDAGTP